MLLVRFLRALPKLDDVSEVITTIRRDDTTCKDIGHVFDSLGMSRLTLRSRSRHVYYYDLQMLRIVIRKCWPS